jgi:hypothetical protein
MCKKMVHSDILSLATTVNTASIALVSKLPNVLYSSDGNAFSLRQSRANEGPGAPDPVYRPIRASGSD